MPKKKSRFFDEETHRFSIEIPLSLDSAVAEYAKKDHHSLSIMCAILIAEAVAMRREKAADDLKIKKPLRESSEG